MFVIIESFQCFREEGYGTIQRDKGKESREIVLLRGSGCRWRKCRFCDYHLDFSKDTEENYRINREILEKITGKYKSLEVINSGSFAELDPMTLDGIERICREKRFFNSALKLTGCIGKKYSLSENALRPREQM